MKALRDWDVLDTTSYLNSRGIDGQVVDLSKAGEGNMNCTLRATLNNGDVGSVILKQSSDFCEKYPDVPAPISRIEEEVRFYNLASANTSINSKIPQGKHFDRENHIFVMQDLGEGHDFSFVYEGENISAEDLKSIAQILSDLHSIDTSGQVFSNSEMRKLNHAHMYDIPLKVDNGLDLNSICSGLDELAKRLKNNNEYVQEIYKLGDCYLQSGETLLHGDFYPNSWLKCNGEIYLIDPEFGFIGAKEFDLGVSVAHLHLSNHPEELINLYLNSYKQSYDEILMNKFTGAEIMRRLLGYAQLPIKKDLKKLESLLELSKTLVLN